jgi:AcrR family transcriptional regulator
MAEKTDRRVQRTRDLLQKAMIELIKERDYDSITVQEIVDRANIGRSAFYLHFNNKDELFVSCHELVINEFHFGPLYPLTREEWLSAEAPHGMTSAYQHLEEVRTMLYPIFQDKNNMLTLRILRDWNAHEIETSLRIAFNEADSTIPLDVLAKYLAGAQIALVQWWLEKRQPHTPERLAQIFYRLQRAAIRDAFAL